MALWEYKVITSGKGGFASATMLESYLNQLGKDEWEIVDFRTDTGNHLAFNGLVRRPTQREWTLEAAIAAAAKAEADKLRAELMQKQHAGDAAASADAGATAGDKAAGPDSLRQLRDTDRDHDPEALADEAAAPAASAEDWSNLDSFEDDLPVFFDAIKPHLRKNQNSNWQCVALNYLAKRWEQPEDDLIGALKECGFAIPEADTDAPAYLEFEGDLYWVEKTNRGLYFLNTREKPRPKFRITQGKPLDPADPAYALLAEEQAAAEAEKAKRAAEQAAREAEAQARRAEREAQRLAAEEARREQQAAAQAAREAREAARLAAQAAAQAAAPAATPESVVPPPESAAADIAPSSPEASAPAEAISAAGYPPSDGEAPAPAPAPAPSGGSASPAPASSRGGKLPVGKALLDAIRPQMRRNRRGPGYSGSSAYLAKFFKVEEPALRAAFAELGLTIGETSGGKVETKLIGAYVYWVNLDSNGVLWINGREASPRDRADAARASAPAAGGVPESTPSTTDPVAASAESEVSAGNTGASSDLATLPIVYAEPPIFRAVPRAMPPIPESATPAETPVTASPSEPTGDVPAAPEVVSTINDNPALATPALTPVPAPVQVPEPVSAPVVEAAEATPPPVAQPLGQDSEPAPSRPGSKPAKASTPRKSRAKAPSEVATETGELPLSESPDSDEAKPVKATTAKPRTKRRASAAIEQDSASEE